MNCRRWGTVLLLGVLAGCATSQEELLPTGDATMMEIWQKNGGMGAAGDRNRQRRLLDARSDLRRPLSYGAIVDQRIRYTREAVNEIYQQFTRLPNPDLVMYVFPHLAGAEPVPVPGYSTVFPLYTRPQYAMPGETARPQLPGSRHERGREAPGGYR
ncbi:hypothetical protein L861_06560 [Litchfieldella anticariensis FP35 = DSM 16096]|uniref:Conjugal transfer protein n=1 Tax=Litchfieldella anticariensis (strain DSM 16096 / CECT 5854 / CIP 108499 / LMG 22089 / FP35) TaxID=1121939 RepID=S2L785_LITA3|nr:TIGR03751 family conjugal transfer lipoprotein [Halomonas anticariensis]EPC00596.1 hypothetical protein L861_06560 [Halomonas anticariensis FP35 = DSM 16096]